MAVFTVSVEHAQRGRIMTRTESRRFAWRMVHVYARHFPALDVHVARDGEPVYTQTAAQLELRV